jgi:hypothetical protein
MMSRETEGGHCGTGFLDLREALPYLLGAVTREHHRLVVAKELRFIWLTVLESGTSKIEGGIICKRYHRKRESGRGTGRERTLHFIKNQFS